MSDRFKFRRRLRCDCGHECWERLDLNATPALSKLDEPCKCHTAVDIISGWEQCTGIKDKNGKLIYECDILKLYIKGKWRGICCVKWMHDEWMHTWQEVFDDKPEDSHRPPKKLWRNNDCSFEIIGNIHENGNLLDSAREQS